MKKIEELVAAVKRHAQRNYETGGWDYVIESYTDEEIAKVIGDPQLIASENVAIQRVADEVGPMDEVRRDIQGA
jgi:hypothetical protein